jgi:hypothetical protein
VRSCSLFMRALVSLNWFLIHCLSSCILHLVRPATAGPGRDVLSGSSPRSVRRTAAVKAPYLGAWGRVPLLRLSPVVGSFPRVDNSIQ